jgi:hypothetical protein
MPADDRDLQKGHQIFDLLLDQDRANADEGAKPVVTGMAAAEVPPTQRTSFDLSVPLSRPRDWVGETIPASPLHGAARSASYS